jgi:RNA polymerase sigma-70 factor (ECF subfamily)
MDIPTEAVWYELHGSLKQFIHKRIEDETAVEDVLQDVFLKVHSRADTLKDSSKVQSWIYQIARNAIIDYYRHHKVDADLSESLPDLQDEEPKTIEEELAPCLRDMIASLPDKYREALLLSEYQGLTQKAIADRLGISVPGAKSRVQRAREMLKQMLLDCCHFEFDRLGKIISYWPRCKACDD